MIMLFLKTLGVLILIILGLGILLYLEEREADEVKLKTFDVDKLYKKIKRKRKGKKNNE
ncbi:hypothetical protein IKS57_05605 [bacterium]|nr:hypothetical protein [bacterium]